MLYSPLKKAPVSYTHLIQLSPPVIFSLERAIEYIEPDELVEATPHFIRLRKRILRCV